MVTVRTADFSEHDYACGRSYLAMGHWQGETSGYRQGIYRSFHGVVEVYEQTGPRPMTNLRFRYGGRDYSRHWESTWGDKTIARLARELVEAVAQ